jgi:YegS/Rv2252/BmrU family lipid kinase
VTKLLLLVVNPNSARRATGKKWPQLEAKLRTILPPFDVALSSRRGDAARIAAEGRGYETIVAVGGDGTINEVANGILDAKLPAALGVLPRGTGSDFARTIGVPHGLGAAARVLAENRRKRIDAGRACYVVQGAREESRWFVNAAEVGIGGMVVEAVNHPSRPLPGPSAFMWAIATTLFRHRPTEMTVTTDGGQPRRILLSNAWIANGRYSGGGILSAPRARVDDGLLDVVLLEHANPFVRLAGLPGLRNGKFTEMRQAEYRHARTAAFGARAGAHQLVELDGDAVGMTPASFEVAPGRLTVVTA